MSSPASSLLTPAASPPWQQRTPYYNPPTVQEVGYNTFAVQELDKLETFYGDLNEWVHRACGTLFETALMPSDPPSPAVHPVKLPSSPRSLASTSEISPSASTPSTPDTHAVHTVRARTPEEGPGSPMSEDSPSLSDTSHSGSAAPSADLHRQRCDASPPRTDVKTAQRRMRRAMVLRQQQHILLLFGDVVHSRMESCSRMKKIVRTNSPYRVPLR